MSSPIVKATIQSALLATASNVTAQLITAWKTQAEYTINWTTAFQFMLFSVLNTPPNFLWQSFLESTFPSTYASPSPSAVAAAASGNEKELDREEKTHEILESKLHVPNTLVKFTLDQTIGAAFNTLIFSLAMAGFKGATLDEAVWTAKSDFWSLIFAGWTVWPLISALNFTLVRSVEMRNLLGSLAGMGWNIYLSLVSI